MPDAGSRCWECSSEQSRPPLLQTILWPSLCNMRHECSPLQVRVNTKPPYSIFNDFVIYHPVVSSDKSRGDSLGLGDGGGWMDSRASENATRTPKTTQDRKFHIQFRGFRTPGVSPIRQKPHTRAAPPAPHPHTSLTRPPTLEVALVSCAHQTRTVPLI